MGHFCWAFGHYFSVNFKYMLLSNPILIKSLHIWCIFKWHFKEVFLRSWWRQSVKNAAHSSVRAFHRHYRLSSHTPNVGLPRYAQRCKNSCEQLIRINAIGDIWFSFHFSVLLVLIGTRLRNAANPFEVECIVRLEALWALLMTLCVTFHLNICNARNEKGLPKKQTGILEISLLTF